MKGRLYKEVPKPYFTEVESTTQPSRPRLRTDFSRPRTQGASVLPPKKKVSQNFFQATSRKKNSFQIFREVFADFPSKVKKGHVHGSFLTKQKKCCPRAEDRTFSRTCGLQGQRLQNVSLGLRTPLRTPFLPLTEVKT